MMMSIDGNSYSRARLAWLYHFGEWPHGQVFHKNYDKADERIDNLEDALTGGAVMNKDPITAERLREITDYDPETGVFRWRSRSGRTGGHTKAGGVVGSWHDNGYRKANIEGRTYRINRLAWLYMTGEWPKALIDHINGDRGDDRFANLREATQSDNVRNGPGWTRRKAPWKGAYQMPNGRWRAMITIGTFDTVEEAHAAYMATAKLLFGEFANDGIVPTAYPKKVA